MVVAVKVPAGVEPMKLTVKQAAKLMGVSEQYIRIGLQRKELDIGVAVKTSLNQWTYGISPAKVAAWAGMTLKEVREWLAQEH